MTDLAADEKLCPFCAEVIKKAAVKCRWCGSDLPAADPEVEPAEVEPVETEDRAVEAAEVEPVETPRRRVSMVTVALVVLVLLAGAGLWLAVRHAADDPVAPDGELSSAAARAGIMAQGGKLAETAMSYRAAQATKDIAAAERLMTPRMRTEYEKTLPPAADRPQQAKMNVTVKATVASLSGKNKCTSDDCAVSLVSATADRARVLVFVNQSATAKGTKNSVASPTWELLTLVKRNGTWLIDDMASA